MAKKQSPKPKPIRPKVEKPPKVEEFMEIGGSPVPGITLRQVLRGHTSVINRFAWSPDGNHFASPSDDKTIRVWDWRTGECVHVLKRHTDVVTSVAWSPDGLRLVSGSRDKTIVLWDVKTGESIKVKETLNQPVFSVDWSPDGRKLVFGSENRVDIRDAQDFKTLATLDKHSAYLAKITCSPDSSIFCSCNMDDSSINLYNLNTKNDFPLVGHKRYVNCVSWSPKGKYIATASGDETIGIWQPTTGKRLYTLESHTEEVEDVTFSFDGKFLASVSKVELIFWRTDTWHEITKIKLATRAKTHYLISIAFHPQLPIIATLGEDDQIIRIWELDEAFLLNQTKGNVSYTTAKLVLVGDSGVGKTGLGWRLAHNEFKEHSSTHGQQFWVVPKLKKTRDDGTECEAVLWDLAGQHIYRSIHSIFLDDVDASLVLFDPTNRQEPLKGAQFWLEQLKGKKQLPPSVLVGARLDRGAPVLSQQELDQFCQKYGISGGYIGTSAKSGEGLDKLLESIKEQIPWDQMTTTVTTVTFKRIKEFVLSLKEKTDRKGVLVKPDELRKQLQATDKDWEFSDVEMMTAVGHLANHGYVTILKSSSGEEYILLVPELLASVASSIFLHADKHPRELGAINETELLQGKYLIEEFKGLEKEEQQVLLDATVVRFLEHSLCFRETLGSDNLLIFPSLIKQKRPLKDDIPATDDISYIVRGRVENIYASLVVLLGYTSSFTRINQWANQAQYETEDGDICGFRLVEDREGEIEIILYYANEMEKNERDDFQALFEQFLYKRDVEVTPFPPVACPNKHRQERATVVKSLREGKKAIFCYECGAKTDLPDSEAQQSIGIDVSDWLKQEEAFARLRNTYEAHLARVKAYRRGWEAPRCYISMVSAQKDWAKEFIRDLKDAGVYVIEDVAKVDDEDIVIVLDSPAYQKAWKAKSLEQEAKLVQSRLSTKKLISIAVQGKSTSWHNIVYCEPGVFCDNTHYPISLFDLVLNLYAIPLSHAGFAPLRQSLHDQWEESLGLKKGKDMATSLKVFISYSHKDEEFKDELVTMLASLQRRGVIDAWQDRRIEEGDEWYQDIQDAMNDCQLAILLVSANFLASRFIQDEELPRLLKRRSEEDLRVVPIIVKQCMWQSEPVIKDLQVMPRDGKPVITFSKDNGDRDQVWTDIAKAIEKRAKK